MSRVARLAVGGALVASLTGCTVPRMFAGVVPKSPAVVSNQLTPCVGDVITVMRGLDVGCDVTPPQQLNETGHTAASCADVGGVFIGGDSGECDRVDY